MYLVWWDFSRVFRITHIDSAWMIWFINKVESLQMMLKIGHTPPVYITPVMKHYQYIQTSEKIWKLCYLSESYWVCYYNKTSSKRQSHLSIAIAIRWNAEFIMGNMQKNSATRQFSRCPRFAAINLAAIHTINDIGMASPTNKSATARDAIMAFVLLLSLS